MNKKTLKSIGAVLAGFVGVVVLSLGTDIVLHAAGVFPPWGQPMSDALFLLATVYRTIYCIAGSYIAARLAPDRPMAHTLALGIVGLVVSTVGAVATWNKGPEFGPHWYPAALIVTAIPCAWLGGKLRTMQLHTRVDS
jgi:drug/metabolite transporter (DMT)-like permease